jgi:hypothetical protein
VWDKDAEGKPASPQDEIAAAEFDEFEDWFEFNHQFTSQVKQIVAVIATRYPDVCVTFIGEKLQGLLGTYSAVVQQRGVLDAYGQASADNPTVLEWDAFSVMFSAIMSQLPINQLATQSPALIEPLLTCTDALVSGWTTTDSLVSALRLKILHQAAPLFRLSKDRLMAAFGLYFGFLSFSDKQFEVSMVTSLALRNVRSQASSNIAHLCQTCTDAIVQADFPINDLVSQVFIRLIIYPYSFVILTGDMLAFICVDIVPYMVVCALLCSKWHRSNPYWLQPARPSW